jgi:hypothetical protein
MRALARAPDQRFTSAEEMADSLRYARDSRVVPVATSPLPDPTAKTIAQTPLVKGVWFVTARRYILEQHGEAELHAVAACMHQDHRAILLEPMASTWYHEDALSDAFHGVMREIARDDPREFARFIEDCTVLGVNAFFRILLRMTSAAFLLRKMPVLTRQYRRNDWTTEVHADDHHASIRYGNCPYLDDSLYRLYAQALLVKVCELGSGKRPRCEITSHSPTSATFEFDY